MSDADQTTLFVAGNKNPKGEHSALTTIVVFGIFGPFFGLLMVMANLLFMILLTYMITGQNKLGFFSFVMGDSSKLIIISYIIGAVPALLTGAIAHFLRRVGWAGRTYLIAVSLAGALVPDVLLRVIAVLSSSSAAQAWNIFTDMSSFGQRLIFWVVPGCVAALACCLVDRNHPPAHSGAVGNN